MTGSFLATSATACGVSSPWSCAAERRRACESAMTGAGVQLTNTPTEETKGGSSRRILRAVAGERERGLSGKKLSPMASAPRAAARQASSAVVTPQTFTRTMPVSYWKRGQASQSKTLGGKSRSLAALGMTTLELPKGKKNLRRRSRVEELGEGDGGVGGEHQVFADEESIEACGAEFL